MSFYATRLIRYHYSVRRVMSSLVQSNPAVAEFHYWIQAQQEIAFKDLELL